MKAWKPLKNAECPTCGSDAEVFTDLDNGCAWDGDIIRCAECGHPGSVSVDESVEGPDEMDGVLRVAWHDDPNWDCCDWCRAHKPKETPDAR